MISAIALDRERRSRRSVRRSARSRDTCCACPDLWTLGFTVSNFPIHVFDLPEGFGIDGLVGLSFLRQFNVEIRLTEGRLLVDRVGVA